MRANKPVVATAFNTASSLRSARFTSAVPHFKRSPNFNTDLASGKTNLHVKITITITFTISVGSAFLSLFSLLWRTIMNTIDTISHMLWSAALLGRPSGVHFRHESWVGASFVD